jgi:hypothetical protein
MTTHLSFKMRTDINSTFFPKLSFMSIWILKIITGFYAVLW